MIDQRQQVGFRIVEDGDRPLLFALYASTREWEFQHTLWSEADKQDFLEGQFKAQDQHYQRAYPNAIRRIVQIGGTDIGRLYLDMRDDCLRIVEFTLAPEWRGRGIGADILRSLQHQAAGGKVPVRLHVDKTSPALGLYLRLGFRQTGDQGHYLALEWRPATGPREI